MTSYRWALALIRSSVLIGVLFIATGLRSQPAGEVAIERYSADAEQAMAARDWPAATKALQQLAKLAPAVPEVHANLGLAYYSRNLVAEAATEFEKALSLNAGISRASWMLGL